MNSNNIGSNKIDTDDNISPKSSSDNSKKSNRRWLTAYVRMHHERKVRDRLTDMGIENFLPVQIQTRQWSDRKKKVERVLISMMIFVNVDVNEERQVLETPSVMSYLVLRGERKPAVIPNHDMQQFRFMVERSQASVNFETTHLQLGEEVRILKGPLTGLVGKLTHVKGKSSIAIQIDGIGCATVEVSADMVERVASDKKLNPKP